MSRPALALASAGGVVAFLGLAILGWGGFDAFFANPARIALVVVTAAMVVAGLFSAANLSTGEREDRSNRWIIGALGLLGLLWRLAAGLHRPQGVLGARWRCRALAGRRAVRRRRRPAVGRSSFSAAASAAWSRSSPVTRWSPTASTAAFAIPAISGCSPVAGLGAGFSLGRGRVAGSSQHSAACRPHELGGEAAARAIRPGIRGLPRSYVAADPGGLLSPAEGYISGSYGAHLFEMPLT